MLAKHPTRCNHKVLDVNAQGVLCAECKTQLPGWFKHDELKPLLKELVTLRKQKENYVPITFTSAQDFTSEFVRSDG